MSYAPAAIGDVNGRPILIVATLELQAIAGATSASLWLEKNDSAIGFTYEVTLVASEKKQVTLTYIDTAVAGGGDQVYQVNGIRGAAAVNISKVFVIATEL